jgi:hypothetical protein
MKNLIMMPLILFGLFFSGSEKMAKSDNSIPPKRSHSSEINMNVALQGAWTTSYNDEGGKEITITTIVMDGYLAETFYNVKTKEFIKTFGGSWTVDNDIFTLTTEFSSSDSTAVGTSREIIFELKGDTITFKNDEKIWTRIDHGKSSDLAGAWLITGRVVDGKINRRENGPRKTMKILSKNRFQWIAYNTETGKFFGTGGGTYTAENGKYTEHIEFFSRDSSRVGASLSFDYEIKENEWHHSGMSSKGNPIYEIWSPRILPNRNAN